MITSKQIWQSRLSGYPPPVLDASSYENPSLRSLCIRWNKLKKQMDDIDTLLKEEAEKTP